MILAIPNSSTSTSEYLNSKVSLKSCEVALIISTRGMQSNALPRRVEINVGTKITIRIAVGNREIDARYVPRA